ncbi:MAG: hydroxyacid dehydrogenase [Piscinibacter sp.]|nr:hydroxyacid dehydrogenase [Piscinibacter sp.]
MTRPRVLLTGPMDPAGERVIAEAAEVVLAPDTRPETLYRLIADAAVLVVRSALPPDLLDHAPRLRGIVRHGVGVDMIPLAAANARRLPVANVPGSNRHAVAEHVLTSVALLRRRTLHMDTLLRERGWDVSRALADGALELHGHVLGIVGVGEVGRRVAEIAHHGYGMQVLGHQRRLDALPPYVAGLALDELLARSDAVVLACPLTDATRHLLDARRLALLPRHAVLVNVARGAVIDEAALVDALREGRLAGAALDVFEAQPLAPRHALRRLDNVLLTPHAAGLTVESMRRMSVGAAAEVRRLLAGEMPLNCVNRSALV